MSGAQFCMSIMDESPYRCTWCEGDKVDEHYHDHHWGVPIHDDQRWFEYLTLEGAQAGLSWRTIVHKIPGYHEAFKGFDIEAVAKMSDKELESLRSNPAIIRNKLKIYSTRTNAQQIIKIQKECDSFNQYLWSFVDNKTIHNTFTELNQVPATTDISEKLSKDLKKRGFKFIGSTICYALMQAGGLVNDHLVDCFRYQHIKDLSNHKN